MRLTRGYAFGGALCLAAAAALAMADHAAAQKGPRTPEGTAAPQQNALGAKQPLLLQADELINDTQRNRVAAKGHVEVYYNNYVLLCDELSYDKTANTLDAIGNVRMKEPDGATLNADRITLTADFRDGFVRSLRQETSNQARIASSSAYRKDGNTTVFNDAVYSPCKACETNPNAPPIWRIKAREVRSDQAERNVYFKDASFEFFGVPTVWVPYFYMPDPTVVRRSGLLSPEYISSTQLGWGVQAPYYFALAPSYDLTVTPGYTSKAGETLFAEWRQRFEQGGYRVRAYGAYNDDPQVDKYTGERVDKFRGSIDTAGSFALTKFWKFGWDATLDSDETFRRYYKIDGIYATDEISKMYVVGQGDRSYLSAQVLHFGNLANALPGFTPSTGSTTTGDSSALPLVDYSYVFARPIVGGELSVNANALSLTSQSSSASAPDTKRIASDIKWRKTMTDPAGQIFTPFLYARGDVYDVSDYEDPVTGNSTNGSLTRGTGAVGLEYRYPFVKQMESSSHVVEPIAQIIARPDGTPNGKIPNQDAKSLVFDDTLLFDINKFSGYDRIETGTRVNAGVQYSMQTNSGWNIRTLVGESYQIWGDNPYGDQAGSGLQRDASDYVAGIYVDMPKYFRVVSQSRFDQDDMALIREDVQLIGQAGPAYASVGYTKGRLPNAASSTANLATREEVSGLAALRLTNYWTLFGTMRYDIKDDQIIADSVGLRYSDECFMMSVVYNEQNIYDGIIQPDRNVMLKIDLLGTGGSSATTDPIRALSPESTLIK